QGAGGAGGARSAPGGYLVSEPRDQLPVRLFDVLAGTLDITGMLRSPEDWRFQYDAAYLASGQAIPLSVSMPLRAEAYQGAAARNWFCNLLPEDLVREAVERRLRIPARDDFAL